MAVSARGASAAHAHPPSAFATDAMLLGMALIWGINYAVVKYATAFMAPLAFNATRIGLAAVVFIAIASRSREARVSRRDMWAMAGLGVLGHGIYQLLFILGIAHSRAGTAALVLAASPAFTALIGRALGVERLDPRGWLGVAMQIAGIALVVLGAHVADTRGDSALGIALLLAGALSWALFSVLIKPYTERVSSTQLGAITIAGGALLVAIIGAPALLAVPWTHASAGVLGAICYSGVGALVIAYLFWYRGVRVIGPTHVAIFSNLQPTIALVFAWLALGEVPTAWQWLGAASIMTGLLISRL
jgi:drug/metabolite transporter (DMT)-like permease